MSAVLVCGTTSDAGKSIVVAGVCRALARRGVRVAPFKAQNMSNNSVVCADGGEIGRAQAMQAVACGVEPSIRFNPILLKPGSDQHSQLVVCGQAVGKVSARNYMEHRTKLRRIAADSLRHLQEEYDVVICEGAGSPAEINLRETDVANFGLAEAAHLPVYIVGDIDRGGVLAHLYGTHQIVSAKDRARIKGFIINKFRGDETLLTPGLDELQRRTGVPTVAVLPFIDGLWIDAEDSLQSRVGAAVGPGYPPCGSETLLVAAIRLPRISNATDVEALSCEPGVTVLWTTDPNLVAVADLVILPGSKSTVADLAWLRAHGLEGVLQRRPGPTLGICGGFQMMCAQITDAVEGNETESTTVQGLGLFDADIEFFPEKTLYRHENGAYEVHHGRVVRCAESPWELGRGATDAGCCVGNAVGTHVHGLLENDALRRTFLEWVAVACGKKDFVVSSDTNFSAERLAQLDRIAECVEARWDLGKLLREIQS